jgi:hypothetical protein
MDTHEETAPPTEREPSQVGPSIRIHLNCTGCVHSKAFRLVSVLRDSYSCDHPRSRDRDNDGQARSHDRTPDWCPEWTPEDVRKLSAGLIEKLQETNGNGHK